MQTICFVDFDGLLNHFAYNHRLMNIHQILNQIAQDEDNAPMEFRIFGDFASSENVKPLLMQVVAIKDKFMSMKKFQRSVKIVNGYNSMDKKNFSSISLLDHIWMDYLDNMDEPNQYILAAADTRYFVSLEHIQEREGVPKVKLYIPNDLPIKQQLGMIFTVAGEIDASADKMSVLDKLAIQQIYKAVYWGESKNAPITVTNIADSLVRVSNIRRFDAIFMTLSLIRSKHLIRVRCKNETGEVYTGVKSGKEDMVNQFLAEHEIKL